MAAMHKKNNMTSSGKIKWLWATAAADLPWQEASAGGSIHEFPGYVVRDTKVTLGGRLKRSARAVHAQFNYLGVWP